MNNWLNDMEATESLLKANEINYRKTPIYDTEPPFLQSGYALWLSVGHIEFSLKGTLENIVTY